VLGHTGSVHVEEERILWSKGLHDASLSRAARPGPRAFHRIDSRSGAPAPSAPSGQSRRRPRLAAPRPPTSRSEYGAFPSTGGPLPAPTRSEGATVASARRYQSFLTIEEGARADPAAKPKP
jgi:hypothetical protein